MMKTYKGFDKNLCCCNGFQYEVGKKYEIKGNITCCLRGFHACELPFEVFDYYDMLNSRFCEVEQSGKIEREYNSTKICSSKIKIVAELKLSDMINLGIKWLKENTSPNKVEEGFYNDNHKDYVKIDSNGDDAKIGSSGKNVQISSSGKNVQIASSGDDAKIGSTGNHAHIGSSGKSIQISSSGYCAHIGSSGDFAKISSSGYCVKIGSSGDFAKISSSDNYAKIGSSGDYAQIGSSGDYAQIGSTGDFAKISSSGYSTRIKSEGKKCVICCTGKKSLACAKKGSWITLSEWKYEDDKYENIPNCVKTEYVDGERIKEDTWYRLVNGEFKETIR